MGNTRTVQTAFRFRPDMVRRMKNKARLQGQSLNAYIENLVEKDLGEEGGRYAAIRRELADVKFPKEISEDIMALSRFKVEFTEEELAADEKLAYLLSK